MYYLKSLVDYAKKSKLTYDFSNKLFLNNFQKLASTSAISAMAMSGRALLSFSFSQSYFLYFYDNNKL